MYDFLEKSPLFANGIGIFNKYIEICSYLCKFHPRAEFAVDPKEISESLLYVLNYIVNDPMKMMNYQFHFLRDLMRFSEEHTQYIASLGSLNDKRFKNSRWVRDPLFAFIRQSYVSYCKYCIDTIEDIITAAPGVKRAKLLRLEFMLKQMLDAFSPTNFPLTNPDVISKIFATKGKNLVEGLDNMLKDLVLYKDFKINVVDKKHFKLGENIATSKGYVVYQNELIQLIYYCPTQEKNYEIPLLIIPPWINKFYIFDLSPENSLVQFLLKEGYPIFIISWKNPDASYANFNFEDYMTQGPLAAIEHIKSMLDVKKVNAAGYCISGTLISCFAAYSEAHKDHSLNSMTLITAMLDFSNAGELALLSTGEMMNKVFENIDRDGVFPGIDMNRTFSALRANDLIWSFFINNYLLGEKPKNFDLLYWNEDYTNLPGEMHKFYLTNMYQHNLLAVPGGVMLNNTPIDLGRINIPCYAVGASEDHIAPWKCTYQTTHLLRAPLRYVLSTSGHVAGVVNPPEKNKYSYFTNDTTSCTEDIWLQNAVEHQGSWWKDWKKWLSKNSGKMRPAISPEKANTQLLEPSPGSYVKERADIADVRIG